MSTGLECNLIEVRRNQWYFILQNPNCPVSCWDWREEDPEVRGPYPNEEACWQGVRRHHANPGGYSADELPPDKTERKLSKLMEKLIAGALRP